MFIKPMLCKTLDWDGESQLPKGYVAEAKLDGHRIHIESDAEGTITCYSRRGKTEKFPDWIKELPILPDSYLDGELVPLDGEGGPEKVAHLRTADPDGLQLVLFEVLRWYGAEYIGRLPYLSRRYLLEHILEEMQVAEPYRVVLVSSSEATGETPAGFAQRIILEGGEGVVLKRISSHYRPGYRGNDWLKIKATFTVDVVITSADADPTIWRVRPGHVDPRTGSVSEEGEPSSTRDNVGLTYGFYVGSSDELITVGSLGVTGPPEEMKRHIGRVAEVKAYGQYTRTGAIRHPVFLRWRDDKDPEECTV